MKKHLTIAALAVLAGLVSCVPQEGQTSISASPSSVVFEGDGGVINVAVSTSFNTFVVEDVPQWITTTINGKELSLTAERNDTKAERSCRLRIIDKYSSNYIDVTQRIGSPVAGHKALASADFEYAGTSLYLFQKPVTENYGGMGFLTVTDLDGNKLEITLFTPLYNSPEDVELSLGEYKAGEDKLMTLYAVPYTWAPYSETVIPGDEEEGDEVLPFGTSYISITDEVFGIASGTMKVEENLLVIDFKDAEGNEYKYAYDGKISITTDGAAYPSDREDPAENIQSVMCIYSGQNDQGAMKMTLMIMSGADPEKPNISQFSFNMKGEGYDEGLDISGTYLSPENREDAGKPDTANLGYSSDDSILPKESYIWFSNNDIFVADGMVSLILEKQESGEYTIVGSMMSSTPGDFYMFMPAGTFPILLMDGTKEIED